MRFARLISSRYLLWISIAWYFLPENRSVQNFLTGPHNIMFSSNQRRREFPYCSGVCDWWLSATVGCRNLTLPTPRHPCSPLEDANSSFKMVYVSRKRITTEQFLERSSNSPSLELWTHWWTPPIKRSLNVAHSLELEGRRCHLACIFTSCS